MKKNVFLNSGNTNTSLDPMSYVKFLNDKSVGEILFNSIDKKGSRSVYDIDFLKAREVYNVPIIISAGCKDFGKFNYLVEQKNIFLSPLYLVFFKWKKEAVLIQYPSLYL